MVLWLKMYFEYRIWARFGLFFWTVIRNKIICLLSQMSIYVFSIYSHHDALFLILLNCLFVHIHQLSSLNDAPNWGDHCWYSRRTTCLFCWKVALLQKCSNAYLFNKCKQYNYCCKSFFLNLIIEVFKWLMLINYLLIIWIPFLVTFRIVE